MEIPTKFDIQASHRHLQERLGAQKRATARRSPYRRQRSAGLRANRCLWRPCAHPWRNLRRCTLLKDAEVFERSCTSGRVPQVNEYTPLLLLGCRVDAMAGTEGYACMGAWFEGGLARPVGSAISSRWYLTAACSSAVGFAEPMSMPL